jgi:hypothetical protein
MPLMQFTDGKVIIYALPNHLAATYTVLNFNARDIHAVVTELMSKGVTFDHCDSEWLKTDEKGIADQGAR